MPVKIAICDDSPSDTQQLKTALLSYDPFFEIETFSSGEELVEKIESFPDSFDILFLDIYMPDLNGIEVAQKIRESGKDIKIVFLTSSHDFYSQAYEVFAFNYIVKPFEIKRLFSVLDHALDDIRKSSGFKSISSIKHHRTVLTLKIYSILKAATSCCIFTLLTEWGCSVMANWKKHKTACPNTFCAATRVLLSIWFMYRR